MITMTAIQNALSLANLADSRNLVIRAVGSSQLDALAAETHGQTLDELKTTLDQNTFGFDPELLIARTNSPVPGSDVVGHNVVMDALIQQGAKVVQQQISFAKTVVAPAVKEIVSYTREALIDRMGELTANYAVEELYLPDPLVDANFYDLVSKYESAGMGLDTAVRPSWPLLPVADIVNHLDVGVKRIDKDVTTWLARLPDTFVSSVWAALFSRERNVIQSTTSLRSLINKPAEFGIAGSAYDVALLVYLLAISLEKDPLPDSGFGIDELSTLLRTYQDVAGQLCLAAYTETQSILKRGKVIIGYQGTRVQVWGNVYQEWLKEDDSHCSEAILGFLVLDSGIRTKDEINASLDAGCDAWAKHVKVLKASHEMTLHDRLRVFLVDKYDAYFRTLLKDQDGFSAKVDETREIFKSLIYRCTLDELKDLWTPVTRAVCQAAFPTSNAEEILLAMDDLCKEHPDTDARERVTMATIQLIGNWLADQMVVSE